MTALNGIGNEHTLGTLRVCGQCCHWVKQPDPPGAVDLERPRLGQCRECRPDQLVIPGTKGLTIHVRYPELPADFAACSRFLVAVAAVEECQG